MSSPTAPVPAVTPLPPPGWLREVALGFAYWLAFLLLLEPGNVVRALGVGRTLDWGAETVRILGAAALGASVTPLLLALVRTFPVEPGRIWLSALVHVIACAAIAALLIVVSCLLAAALLPHEVRPLAVAIRDEMAGNWALLGYCIAAFVAGAHVLRHLRGRGEGPPSGEGYLQQVTVPSRGRTRVLDLSSVHWIETQGNYLALHAADGAHLIRQTLRGFEARLDPQRFVRIHRRAMAAVSQIDQITPLEGGDAALRLKSGAELRLSRSHRREVMRRLTG